MSVQSLARQPVTVYPSTQDATDEYGNAVPSGAAVGVPESALLEMKSTQEALLNRDTTVTKWHATLHAESVVTALSTITVGAQSFQVDGEPWHVFNPRTGVVSHIEVDLTAVT